MVVDPSYSFVVAADTQFGMTKDNQDWEAEKEYSRQAIAYLNGMKDRPLFCCVCGDLVDMTSEIYRTKEDDDGAKADGRTKRSREECDRIQDQQNADFKAIWSTLHPDIALVCVCGNHDVGNSPTKTSIERFRSSFGDDYLSFWAKDSFNIVVNTSLFNDQRNAPDLYREQFAWLKDRLQYAQQNQARHIFVFGHHPWFLYREDEDQKDMQGASPLLPSMGGMGVKDSYFVIPLSVRQKVMALFAEYKVTAAFAGHFHQNMVSRASFGLQMIVTSSLSVVMRSNAIPKDFEEPNTRGLRVVNVDAASFTHKFVCI